MGGFGSLRFTGLALVLALAAPRAQAGPERQSPEQPTFRSGVDLVRVDAIVTDRRGQAITDLTAADFEILENGVRQDVASAELVATTGRSAAEEPRRPIRERADVESAVERGDRLFVIFLDEYHVLRGRNTIVVRDALARFVRFELGPDDLIALMYPFTSIFNLRFTREKEGIAREILKFEGRADDFVPRRPIEDGHGRDMRRLRNEVVLTALAGLATHLQSYGSSRKTVILATEGMTSGGWRTQADFYQRVRDIFTAANRGNTALYPLDPAGLGPMRAATEALHVLATQTNGVALVNRNDLDRALRVVSRDASAYYLLGYYPSDTAPDGKWRDIKVRVRRPGAEVRSRKGYAAFTAEEHASRSKPVVEPPREALNALAVLAAPRSGRFLDAWIGYEIPQEGPAGRAARVFFAWAPSSLAGSDTVAVSIVATGADRRECFRGGSGHGDERGGQATFDVTASGDVQVQVEARTPALTHRDRYTITIPDAATTPLGLDTPRVVRTRTATELQRARDDPDAAVTIGREFRRTDRLLIRTGTFGTAAGGATLTARLLTRSGQQLANVTSAAAEVNAGKYIIDLPLSNFATGEFLLELRVASPVGEAKELIAFRVVRE